jgi:hypothetical protein
VPTPPRAWRPGALLELVTIIANPGTAVVLFSILKRQSEAGAVAYVSARIVECVFIAIGIISLLAFLLMRQEATAGQDAALGQVSSLSMIGRS